MRLSFAMISFIAISLVVTLAGCSYLIQQDEKMRACNESAGGSQQACDALSEQYAADARDAVLADEERLRKQNSRDAATNWRNEVSFARREDPQTIQLKYPDWGWMSGLWCGYPLIRIEIEGPDRIRQVSMTSFFKTGYPTTYSMQVDRFHLRTNGDEIEAWGGYKYSTRQFTFRKDTPDKFTITSWTTFERNSTDPSVPFSGVVKKVSRFDTEIRRCKDDQLLF